MEDHTLVDGFATRHIGPRPKDAETMLRSLGLNSLEELVSKIIPSSIRLKRSLNLPKPLTEQQALAELKTLSERNKIYRSYLGMGYANCHVPSVIQRNVLENPGWYTQYTPYQAEIAQGRLEALLNFQTMVCDLTGMAISNASLLDEATAAAEAMSMSYSIKGAEGKSFFVSEQCHPQVIDVIKTRAKWLGINVIVGDHQTFDPAKSATFGCILQYPATNGTIPDYTSFIKRVHDADGLVSFSADVMSLVLLAAPGELGADIVVGSTQRFGVPMGFGGPHAAFLATKDEYKRQMPGRIVGMSKDAEGRNALRLALQTREQHIRRDKATSNICTAQVLPAIMASMYAVYHGPAGLIRIAQSIHWNACLLAAALKRLGHTVSDDPFFDTVKITIPAGNYGTQDFLDRAKKKSINLRKLSGDAITISLDETTTASDIKDIISVFSLGKSVDFDIKDLEAPAKQYAYQFKRRTSSLLAHPVFNKYQSETEFLRYVTRLQSMDLSLAQSMIPLGSCTMKLNATTEMVPVSYPGFNQLHPFVPEDQTEGYRELLTQLETWLSEITGFAAISLQPNSGSQGEYAGLLVIRKYLESRGDKARNICLIPRSAHGTNPASAVMAGMKVVVVECDDKGNVNIADLKAKATEHSSNLAALMITYPSTHGVFEEGIREICQIIHDNGGQVYMDGANMNAQVGLCRPGDFGADVCHLNLHKTFCIPHGGGGPGMGPIGVASHLAPYLPSHPVVQMGPKDTVGTVSAAPWGSPSILPISWAYIAMMGAEGLRQATQMALLNANYIATQLKNHFPILYTGSHGYVAHECIIDLRALKQSAGIEPQDIAKRLMDYGFHAPTVSFPVAGTMMIEPTESESKEEIDRFCDAMIRIREEIRSIESGRYSKESNPLKNAPHTASMVTQDNWNHSYSRSEAVFPTKHQRTYKFWPAVARINEVLGDRNLICTCAPIEEYTS